jgi:hypothetical protein
MATRYATKLYGTLMLATAFLYGFLMRVFASL